MNRLRIATGLAILTSVYVAVFAVYTVRELARIDKTVARHSTQIETILSGLAFSESMQSKIMEKLNGR